MRYDRDMSAVNQLLRMLAALSMHGASVEKAPVRTELGRRRRRVPRATARHPPRVADKNRIAAADIAASLSSSLGKYEFAIVAIIGLPEWTVDYAAVLRATHKWVVETGQKKRWPAVVLSEDATKALLVASIDELMAQTTCKACNGQRVVFKDGWKDCDRCHGSGEIQFGRRQRLAKLNVALAETPITEHAYRRDWQEPHAAVVALLQTVVASAVRKMRTELTRHPHQA